ncbi:MULTISPECIES: hypothetical protein [Moorena]|uniref:Uncharacterized protein n=1 Tax=Moorena producens 3L TaxID=489825 RepID=F4Y0K2_9CYAN|nr:MULTISPECIES: hypothetical protein [Moorena]NEQ17958.1 hypothetical protein [Moorena sp. SIO3E2]EGJ29626.1 hypothetical protein LYNGBM3L_61960 [Moorena producens 3L]NEP32249.1 hypothetical protein [Moorena sp. SIO3B2]NEP66198.1 hypothetical protein [Moorena sp. SIO3A5]NEQ09340.1 hypothetical protein [Moorena sp. SIO4E2]
MKFATIAQAKRIIIFILTFCLSGCFPQLDQLFRNPSCRKAEEVVKTAQNKFNSIVFNLTLESPDQETIEKLYSQLQILEESEEKAYQICQKI